MAKRADWQGTLPRQIKRMLALSPEFEDEHRRGEIRRLFIDAHTQYKASKNRRAERNEDDKAVASVEVTEQPPVG
jgi:cation transport regulator ChaB